MKIKNLTPHDIIVGGKSYPVSGEIWRAKTICNKTGEIDGAPAVKIELLADEFPPKIPGTMYIVPRFTLSLWRAAGREDSIAPDTSPDSVIRDDAGRIVGVRRWEI